MLLRFKSWLTALEHDEPYTLQLRITNHTRHFLCILNGRNQCSLCLLPPHHLVYSHYNTYHTTQSVDIIGSQGSGSWQDRADLHNFQRERIPSNSAHLALLWEVVTSPGRGAVAPDGPQIPPRQTQQLGIALSAAPFVT